MKKKKQKKHTRHSKLGKLFTAGSRMSDDPGHMVERWEAQKAMRAQFGKKRENDPGYMEAREEARKKFMSEYGAKEYYLRKRAQDLP